MIYTAWYNARSKDKVFRFMYNNSSYYIISLQGLCVLCHFYGIYVFPPSLCTAANVENLLFYYVEVYADWDTCTYKSLPRSMPI